MPIGPGDKVTLANPTNGYEYQIKKAAKLIEEQGADFQYTIRHVDVHNWHTEYFFEEVAGAWNSVQFEKVRDENVLVKKLKKYQIRKTETRTDIAIVEAEDEDAAYEMTYEDLDWESDKYRFNTDYDVTEIKNGR